MGSTPKVIPGVPTLFNAAGYRPEVAQDANRQVRQAIIAAALAGVSLRSGQGLLNMFRRNTRKRDKHPSSQFDLPLPSDAKFASAGPLIQRGNVLDPAAVHYRQPLFYAGGTLAGILGYKGTDWLLDRRRRAVSKGELEKARAEFQKAMLDSYQDKGNSKSGSDDLAKAYEKWARAEAFPAGGLASWNPTTDGMNSKILSNYLAATLLAAGIGGISGYEHGKSRSRKAILEKAKKQKAREEYSRQPFELSVRPKLAGENLVKDFYSNRGK